jgi:excisionase family DNA binding protein
MKPGYPLMITFDEACNQIGLSAEDVAALIKDGELVAVKVRGKTLVFYESVVAFARRARRNAVTEVSA